VIVTVGLCDYSSCFTHLNSQFLLSTTRLEKSYDVLPNFTAADIVRVMGIGRNQYLNLMNSVKSKVPVFFIYSFH
jgi:hypothetical protein